MMNKISVLLLCFVAGALAAPRYGADGGYQGYASYKPMKGLNSLLSKTGLRPDEESSDLDISDYGHKNKNTHQKDAPFKPVEYSVPKTYEALTHVPQQSPGYSNNQLIESSASPYEQAAVYGNANGGYKISDVYSNDYSGNSHEEYDNYADYHPHPYEYGYQVKDKYGNEQFRAETSDSDGKVKGEYGFRDEHGLYRRVEYTADKSGFRANVKTNEPGTGNQDPADVHIDSSI